MKHPLILAALAVASVLAFSPLPSQAQPHISVMISNAPPAPLYERAPPPRHGQVWAPGYWEWRGQRHAWVPGHYVRARPGYVYAPPMWQQRQGRWVMHEPRWERQPPRGPHGPRGQARGHAKQDRDRDGVPNRHDRRPNDPRRY